MKFNKVFIFLIITISSNCFGSNLDEQLIEACNNGEFKQAQEFLSKSANSNFHRFLWGSPLINAIKNGHVEIVKLLIDYNAEINLKCEREYSPYTRALIEGNEDIINLLKNKTNININVQDSNRKTDLCKAVKNNINTLRLLLQHKDIDVNINDGDALIAASYYGYLDKVKLLLEHPKIDINIQGTDGCTALMIACRVHFLDGNLDGHVEIVKLLLNRNEINVKLKDRNNETALDLIRSKLDNSRLDRKCDNFNNSIEIEKLLNCYENEYLPYLTEFNNIFNTNISGKLPVDLVGLTKEYISLSFPEFLDFLKQQKEDQQKLINSKIELIEQTALDACYIQ